MNFESIERIYLPPAETSGRTTEEYLNQYISKEFPFGSNSVYSIPRNFIEREEKQASKAERTVFTRLHGLNVGDDIWILFFHGSSYAGRSHRNHRIGKLMIREHDFVIFTKYKNKFYVILAEVKSTHDAATKYPDITITSDAKVVKNNKRSAQHQLRDHTEMIEHCLGTYNQSIQCFIMWPFLSSLTKDPKQSVMKRWKEDGCLHVFEDSLQDQDNFNQWFLNNVLNEKSIDEIFFNVLLNRFIILSCGVFVDEIHEGMLALLTQNQLQLLTSKCSSMRSWNRGSTIAQVIHAAAGTGKTLLALKKIQLLYEQGELNENKRALYICYWPGIQQDLVNKLRKLNLSQYVDTARFYITQTGFLLRNKSKYKHIFMDEAEAICLAYDNIIMMKTISEIYQRYHDGNCTKPNCTISTFQYNRLTVSNNMTEDCAKIFENHSIQNWGELWFLVDINQASLFLPKRSPDILKKPTVVLNQVMRSTTCIFDILKQFYMIPYPMMSSTNLIDIHIGHNFNGPPIYWVNSNGTILNTLIHVVIDLCSTKGIKPNNLSVIPFMMNENFTLDVINNEIGKHFVENGYRPKAVWNVEDFITESEVNEFLITWALRVKGLEFKVVVIVIDEEDFDINDIEDQKKMYIMASRCTCLLIIISSEETKMLFDKNNVIQNYRFDLTL